LPSDFIGTSRLQRPHDTRAGAAPLWAAWQDDCMSEGFGIEIPGVHRLAAHRKPARYLIVIDAAGSTIARLFLDTRELVGEFDAGTEEVAQMTKGSRRSSARSAPNGTARSKATAPPNVVPLTSTRSMSEPPHRSACAMAQEVSPWLETRTATRTSSATSLRAA
jgi:hypothetical protein